jgi:hypothetical protein
LGSDGQRGRIVAIAAIYMLFAAVIPTAYIKWIGSSTELRGHFTVRDWPILLAGTLLFRLYDLHYYQLISIARAAWMSRLGSVSFPARPFSRRLTR